MERLTTARALKHILSLFSDRCSAIHLSISGISSISSHASFLLAFLVSERSLIFFGVPNFFGVLGDPTRLSLTTRTHGFLVPPYARRLLVIFSLAIIQAPSCHFADFSLLNSCFEAGLA